MKTLMGSPPTTPPTSPALPQLRSRPVPRLSRPFEDPMNAIIQLSPSPTKSPFPPSLTIHQLLLLPPSPDGSNFHHFANESLDNPPSEVTSLRKGKNRPTTIATSPRNGTRRARRRLVKEIWKDEKEASVVEDETGKLRKRTTRPRPVRKENMCSVLRIPSSTQTTCDLEPEINNIDVQNRLDSMSKALTDLFMWKNMAKSSFWFSLGSCLILSSIFSGDFRFSIISAVSNLAILVLVLAFFYDSFKQRNLEVNKIAKLQLTEEEVLRVARVILPLLNAVIAKCQDIFSGEPLMTLKVGPILLLMAMYGHLITLWRLVAIGFFLCFTAPRLYSCYYHPIQQIAEDSINTVIKSWRSCSRKNLVATLAAALLWNMSSIKMRTYAAFIIVVIIRCHRQRIFVGKYIDEIIGDSSLVPEQHPEKDQASKNHSRETKTLPRQFH